MKPSNRIVASPVLRPIAPFVGALALVATACSAGGADQAEELESVGSSDEPLYVASAFIWPGNNISFAPSHERWSTAYYGER